MADFTITVSNAVGVLGPGPTTKWNEFNWGTGLWGDGYVDLDNSVGKVISESVGISDSLVLSVGFIRTFENSIAPTFEMSSEELKTGAWNYVFTRPSIDAENRTSASFTTQAGATTTWTSGTATSTSWSEQ